MASVRKAVIPAAGLGTRFLPVTKAIPKEMLPVVDRPVIQYAVQEAVDAGITDILLITAPSKKSIEDHFDSAFELEALLESRGKFELLSEVKTPASLCQMHFTRQGRPLGLGHAIGLARSYIGDEPFAVLLPDDILVDGGELLTQMIEVQQTHKGIVVAAGHFPSEEVISYGVIETQTSTGDVLEVENIIEKPKLEDLRSNYGLAPGRYIFPPDIFNVIDQTPPGVDGEIQITDAIAAMIPTHGVRACVNHGKRYDAGQKLDYLRATVEIALDHPELGAQFREILSKIVSNAGIE